MTTAAITSTATSPYYYESGLTPEAMMIYLSTRLEGLDDQIQIIFGEQETADKIRKELNALRTALDQLTENTEKNKSLEGDPAALQKILTGLESIALLDPELADEITRDLSAEGQILHDPAVNLEDKAVDSGLLNEAKAAFRERMLHEVEGNEGDPAFKYTSAELQHSLDYLKSKIGELESASQMNMINLQSLMSSRQTAISLATNLISKLSDAMQKVVDNIR